MICQVWIMGNCHHCGKELTNLQRKFCSKICRNKTYAPNYGTPAYRPKSPKESDYCAVCNKLLTGRQTRYCSVRCKHIALENSYPSQIRRGLSRKLSLVKQFGGQCRECGYAKNLSVLSFHHKEGKEFMVNRAMLGQRSIERITREVAKCDLLCANCHLELHNPTLAADLLGTYLMTPKQCIPRRDNVSAGRRLLVSSSAFVRVNVRTQCIKIMSGRNSEE